MICFIITRGPPRATRTDTRSPYTTLCRSPGQAEAVGTRPRLGGVRVAVGRRPVVGRVAGEAHAPAELAALVVVHVRRPVAAGKAQRRGHGLERAPALLSPVVERRVRQQDVAQGALDLVGLLPVGSEHRGRPVDQLLARAVGPEAWEQLLAPEFVHP